MLSLLFFSVFAAFFFTVSIAAQFGLGYSALRTGALTFPFAVGAAIGSLVSPLLIRCLGPRTLAVGMLAFTVSLGWTATLIEPSGHSLDIASLLLPLIVGGLGTGVFIAPLQATILGGTTPTNVGSASGSIPTIQQIGCSIGLAVISIFFFNQVAAQADHAVEESSNSLTRGLESTAINPAWQPMVVDEFSRCAHLQLTSSHPETTPPGCDTESAPEAQSDATPTDIRSSIGEQAKPLLQLAARDAAARSFLGALTVVLWAISATAAGLAALSLLIKRSADPDD